MSAPTPRVSVIVCTYNHSGSLVGTLASLAALQAAPDVPWELVVVDNNSNDDTRAVVERFFAEAPVAGRYVFEGRQGLSAARNCGMQAARGEIVAFTDDDVKVGPDWVQRLHEAFVAHPQVGMVCGRTELYRETLHPLGVRTSREARLYEHPAQPVGVGIGNNMAIRMDVVRRTGEFDVTLGAGTRMAAAEDTDYIYRVLRSGLPVLYCPDAVVYHDHDRVTDDQVRRIQLNYRRGCGALYVKHIVRGDAWALKLFYWELRDLARGLSGDRQARADAWAYIRATLEGGRLRVASELRTWLGRT